MRTRWSALLVLALLCCVPLLFPLDAPWINDEPILIATALQANQAGRLAVRGLEGTRQLHYGPFPIWVYQAFLALSRDLRLLVLLRASITFGAVAWALWSLARSARLWLPFSFTVLLSPYLWFQGRLIWDNSFCIPLTAIALACFARFLEEKEALPLFGVLLACTLLFATHLMALAFIVPLGAWLAVVERRSLWRLRLRVLPALALCGVVAWPYVHSLLARRAGWMATRSLPCGIAGYWFPWTAGRVLSGDGLDYYWEGGWLALPGWRGTLFQIARAISSLSYLWVWAGILLGTARVLRSLRRKRLSVTDCLTAVCLVIFIAQCVLDGLTGSTAHPHYFNGTWIAYVFLAWLAVDALASKGWAAVSWIQDVSLAGILCFLVIQTHLRGGTRGIHYGATLGNQLAIAEELNANPGGRVENRVYQYALFPHALEVLRSLRPAIAKRKSTARLEIVYATSDPYDGHLAVRVTGVRPGQP